MSPYVRFLMETKGQLRDLPAPKRGVAIATLYRALNKYEKAALVIRANKTKLPKRVPKEKEPNTYRQFLKAYWFHKRAEGAKYDKKSFGERARLGALAFAEYKVLVAEKGLPLTNKIDKSLVNKLCRSR